MSIGSIGNLVSIMSEKNLDQMMKEQQGEELMNLVIGLIFSRVDVPLLCEICRFLSIFSFNFLFLLEFKIEMDNGMNE